MMSRFRSLVLAFLSLPALLHVAALADTYQLTTITNSQSATFYGIDNQRNVTVQYSGRGTCGGVATFGLCYQTLYTGSGDEVFSLTPPTLQWDNGTICRPNLSGFSITGGLCNGAHFLAAGIYILPDSSLLRGIWGGPNPDLFADLLSLGTIDGGLMNALGDAVFIDGLENTLVFAQDLSSQQISTTLTPEPSSFLLLVTGVLASAASLRRFFSTPT